MDSGSNTTAAVLDGRCIRIREVGTAQQEVETRRTGAAAGDSSPSREVAADEVSLEAHCNRVGVVKPAGSAVADRANRLEMAGSLATVERWSAGQTLHEHSWEVEDSRPCLR